MKKLTDIWLSDFRTMLTHIDDNSTDLVVADWPFRKGTIDKESLKMYKDGTKEATRILSSRGNYISIHYLRNNLKVATEAYRQGLDLKDHPVIPMVCKSKTTGTLGRAFISIFVFSKSDNRIFNDTSKRKNGRYFKKEDVLSDMWLETEFRNGYYNKANKENIPEAMPRSVVKKIMNLYTVKDSQIVDFFGGSGNFSLECVERGLKCTTSELDPNRYYIINRRLSELSSQFIEAAKESNYTNIQGDFNGRNKEKRQRMRAR